MRRLFVAALLVSLLGTAFLSADEPAALRPTQRKMAIEKILDAPLNWDLGDREQVTLAELIQYVHDQHQLQIRWDAVSLGLIFGDHSPLEELLGTPLGLQAYYSSSTPWATEGLVTCPATSQPNAYSVQTQPQPFNPYGAPSEPTVAQGPYAPSTTGYAAAYPAQAPQAVNADGIVAAPVPAAPLAVQPAGRDVAPPGSATVGASNQVAPSVPYTPPMDQPAPDNVAASGPETMIAKYLTSPISLSSVSLQRATVREGLRQLLDAVSARTAVIPFSIGIPVTTRALTLDLLVDENSVLITTQLRASAVKETRVYRLGALSEMPPELLERVITHSVRPWSWRNQANEIAQQLASRWPKASIPLPGIEINAIEGIKLKSAEEGAGAALSADAKPNVSEETIAATGQLVAGGAVAMVHSIVAALEIVHHGDPPTGVIESLPGMLIITQSQAAHREIKELLDELSEGQ